MTDDEREHLRILTVKEQDAYTVLMSLCMLNQAQLTHIELIDRKAAIYAAEIEHQRALNAVREFQARLIAK